MDETYEGLEHRSSAGDGSTATWQPLPPWSLLLCRLGTSLAALPERRSVVVISLPFRSFAAVFVALGYVIERLQAGSFEDRFKPGDLVLTVHRDKSGRNGHLAEFRGYLPLSAQVGAPGIVLLRARDEPECKQWRTGGVQLVRYSGGKGLRKRQRTVVPLPTSSFRTALVGPDEEAWLGGRTLVGLVGHFPGLAPELGAEVFRHSDTAVEGTLSEVLLLNGNIRAASANSAEGVDELRESNPEVVVFDGATSFGKWRHRFDSSHHVVAMDRGSPFWADETAIIRSAIAMRTDARNVGALPRADGTGVDLVGFCR